MGKQSMRATIRITFENEGQSVTASEKVVEFTDLRASGGAEFVAKRLFAEAEMKSLRGKYHAELPDASHFLRAVRQAFRPHDLVSGDFDDRTNTRLLWIEIGNTLLHVTSVLSKSRAYHQVQRSDREGIESETLLAYLHLDKMDNFNLALIFLEKVSELTARLIFERLGASFIPKLDRNKTDWERDLTWTAIRSFERGSENPQLGALSDSEYQEVREILDGFVGTEEGNRLRDYRNKLVHRIAPSVDEPQLYTHLEDRRFAPTANVQTGARVWTRGIGGMPTSAEYSFPDLYHDAAE